jgi:hypothetical protein
MDTGHSLASEKSKELCDLLFSKLKKLIPDLQISPSKRWCGFFKKGLSRFAFVNHRKRLSRIEVWCLGDPEVLQKNARLHVEERKATTGGFGILYQARFFVDAPSQIDEAVHILFEISYPKS